MAITRRDLLKSIGATGAALSVPALFSSCAVSMGAKAGAKAKSKSAAKTKNRPQPQTAAGKNSGQRKPNIVFIMADQLAASFIGCYGSGVASTPTLDHIASVGVRFDRNYAVSPVCTPNRCSIFTGRSPEVHGMITNNYHLTTDAPLFTHVLKTQGYRTGGFGKFHFTEMPLHPYVDLKPYGFDEAVMTEDPRFGHWLDWIDKEHHEYYETALGLCWPQPYMKNYNGQDIEAKWHATREKILGPIEKASPWYRMYTSPLPKELQQTVYITDRSLDFLRNHHNTHADQPFCAFISYVAPHDPYDPPKPYDTMFNPADMKAPIKRAVDKYDIPELETARDYFGPDFGSGPGAFRNVSDNIDTMKKLRALYHGNIKLIDEQIARVVKYLEEIGEMENTIIVFTTDHGDMMGDHGFVAKGMMHYDTCIRTPLIVAGRGIKGGVVSPRMTSSLDLYPTFCEWAGASLLPPLEGKSFAGTCGGDAKDEGWSAVPVELFTAQTIVTKDQWRYTLYLEPGKGQMFNLKDDPEEQRDLFHDKAMNEKHLELAEDHARTYLQTHQVPQYRVLPIQNGHHCLVHGNYELTEMPW